VAAGVLLVEEAGGRVTHYDGRPFDHYHPPIAASNGLVHDAMLVVLQQP
jgi:myo-inositol-1(or 4)-monophosphatase